MDDQTTIALEKRTADQLHDLKNRGESYDDVITDLLAAADHRLADAGPHTQPPQDNDDS